MKTWLAVLSLLLAAPQAPDPQAGNPPDLSPLGHPPPGTPEDQALWREARDLDATIPSQWRSIVGLQARIGADRLGARLDEAAARGPESSRPAAARAKRDLEVAWTLTHDAMTTKRLVDQTRVCAYPLLDFASAMGATATEADRQALSAARVTLKICADRARQMSAALGQAHAGLASAREAAEKVLAPAPKP